MAIFKKLNIGDTVASSGTRVFKKLTTAEVTPEEPSLPKLIAPTIRLDGDFILITNNNDVTVSTYKLYVDGKLSYTLPRENEINLNGFIKELGTHEIFVVAVKPLFKDYEDSDPSNTVKYVCEEHTIPAGTYVFNEVLPRIGFLNDVSPLVYELVRGVDTTLFTANGTSYNLLEFCAYDNDRYYIYYAYLYGSSYTKYHDYAYSYGLREYEDGWQNKELRTINLLEGFTTRSNTLYEWWIANTTNAPVAGLYDADDNLVASWDTLVDTYGMDESWGDADNPYWNGETQPGSPTSVLNSNSDLAGGTKFVIANSITKIGTCAFRNCTKLTSIYIPESVKQLSGSAFSGCTSLESIILPDSVTFLGHGAFADCTSLQTIVIGTGMDQIATIAFINCTSLTDVYYRGTEEQWAAIYGIENLPEGATIHYNSQ